MTSDALPEVFESSSRSPCNNLGQKVSCKAKAARWASSEAALYDPKGERKYLNRDERARVLNVMDTLDPAKSLFALVLAWTGARVSEVLALTPASFQLDSSVVTIVTLKRRKPSIREVPIPPSLMAKLERVFALRRMQQSGVVVQRLWPWCRVTAWRLIKKVMALAQVTGRGACPRGLRHGFGVGTLQSGVPLNLIQRWLGHARLTTTAIYAAACGPEELAFARQFWRSIPASKPAPPTLRPQPCA
ncbi:integrase [Rhodopseudomonas rhenobacensis]|uniref:Integrase n=1 Tax=Rhodopseudomonas rhenobacensis TaxID=87461 RepID=A0A7W7Z656_9BRAD|nr:site-specific integrase [Rhodopseudomonas rhenobacensis]MBB5048525.1 integrase [Rhodopseudomonas rhenobacensis]